MKKRNLKKYVLILSFLSIVFSSESINAQSDKPNTNENKINGYEITKVAEEMPNSQDVKTKYLIKKKRIVPEPKCWSMYIET